MDFVGHIQTMAPAEVRKASLVSRKIRLSAQSEQDLYIPVWREGTGDSPLDAPRIF